MNFVRLGVMWEAVEIAPGVFNETYLDEVDKMVEMLSDHGIYTMVDAHQDVLAKMICGHGMPNFYAKEIAKGAKCRRWDWKRIMFAGSLKKFGVCKTIADYDFETDADGNPLIRECMKNNFIMYYGLAESLELFDSLYTNKHGLTDKFLVYWDKLAERFTNNPNIMGFVPLNEPFCSNFMSELSLMMPKNFDKEKLLPLYEKVYQVLQKHDKNANLHFETAQMPNIIGAMNGIVRPVGFDRLPGIPIQTNAKGNVVAPLSEHHVLHDHFYCCQVHLDMCNKRGEPKSDERSAGICRSFHHRRMNQRIKDAKSLNVPLMITEFGACYNSEVCVREINQVLDESERTLSGWAYWQFK